MPVVIFFFLAISFVSLQRFSAAMERQIQSNRNLLSRSYSARLDGVLSRYSIMAQDLSSETVTAIHIESTLLNFQKRYPQFSNIFYTSMDGRVLESAPYKEALQGFDFKVYRQWEDALERKGAVVSGACKFLGEPALLIFSPVLVSYVYGEEPQPQGMIVLILPRKGLFRELENSPVEDDVVLFVSDSSGEFLYSKGGTVPLPGHVSDLSDKVSLDVVIEAMGEGQSGFATYGNARDKGYISFTAMTSLPWSLGFIGEYSGITGEIRGILRINALIILLGMTIGSLILFFIVHSVVKPIESLTEVARKIAGGDREAISEVNSSSEVGVLSRAMNGMISELRLIQEGLEKTVEERTIDLKRTNEELNSTVEELNSSNWSLKNIRDNLERLVVERSGELKNAHMYIDNIINSMPSVIIGIDPGGMITQWNREAEKRIGVSAGKAVGESLEECVTFLADHKGKILKAIEEREIYRLPQRKMESEGTICIEETTLYPLVANGISGGVIRIDDVTERVVMEESLRHSQKMEGIGQLSSGIAHDFNNMLGGIMGGAELLSAQLKGDPKSQKYLSLIVESVQNASDLTRKLLSFSRKGGSSVLPLDIHEVLRETFSLLERTLHKKIVLKAEFNAPASVIMGDQSQLQNAFLNLGINADHAMAEGGTLTVKTEIMVSDYQRRDGIFSDAEPGKYIKVVVSDTGAGIKAEHLKKIFEPFFTTKEKGRGTGLGLSAVYNTVKQHNGHIKVTSRPGEGTQFHLLFPLSGEPLMPGEDSRDPVRGKGTILFVEDEPVLRESVKELLEDLGYGVLLARNGREGFDTFLKEREGIDLVLLDMIMPEMDGKSCFLKIRGADSQMPVIMASGFSREADVEELLAQGLAAFLHKPYKILELSRIIAGILTS